MIDVTCAIIRNEDDEVLVVQRGEGTDHPFQWEFPGGKVHQGETEEECIIREVKEELSMDIVIVSRLAIVEHDYGFKQIRLIPFVCDTLDELPFLTEHAAFKWLVPSELSDVDFSDADIPVAKAYIEIAGPESKKMSKNEPEGSRVLKDDMELQSIVTRMMGMKEAEMVALSAAENSEIFDRLLEYSFSDDAKLAFRASWTLTKVCDKYPEIIFPHLDTIVERLDKIENESTLRSFLRIISLTDIGMIDSRYHGILTDQCFAFLKSGFSAVAVKAYAMEILYKLALKYPELKNELSETINLLKTEGSAGIIARGKQILQKLSGPKKNK
jgi:8-oxo-dGTP diphosphatase